MVHPNLLLFGIFLLAAGIATAQNVGIGTSAPTARLHVTNGSLLIEGTTGGTPVTGTGTRLMWIPAKRAFRAGNVVGDKWDDGKIGTGSFSFGQGEASGSSSIALLGDATASSAISIGAGSISSESGAMAFGFNAEARGSSSIAIGDSAVSAGPWTLAAGYRTRATGYYAAAIGRATYAKCLGCMAVGAYNDSSDAPTPNVTLNEDRIFQIGIGSVNTRKNIMTILRGGLIGINTLEPDALLHVANGVVLADGSTGAAPNLDAGNRMMWVPAKAAFRAGTATASGWDDANLGANSFATGFETVALTDYSTAWGYQSAAKALRSTAGGNVSTATGNSSVAIGWYAKSKAVGSAAFGCFNDSTDNPSAGSTALTDRIFQVGNGSPGTTSNALTILRNGNVGIGVLAPTRKLEVAGTADFDGTIVANNRGFVQTASSSSQQKILITPVAVNIASMAANATTTVPFTWPESFGGVPVAYVANVTVNSGGFAETDFTLASITATGGVLWLHNTNGAAQLKSFTINVIGMGAQ